MLKSLVLIFIYISIVHSVKLTIREAGADKDYFVQEEKLLELTCISDSISQQDNIEWFIPSSTNAPVTNTDSTKPTSIFTERIGNNKRVILNIREASLQHDGRYCCKSIQYEGSSQKVLDSICVKVKVYKPITVKNCRVKQWLRIYAKGSLRCELSSIPTASVSWVFKGKHLQQSLKYKILPGGIIIANVTKEDEGHYVVKGAQDGGQSSIALDILVTVYEIPKITWGPQIVAPVNDGVPEDWYADIRCLAEGNPMPTVHWFRRKYGWRTEVQTINTAKYFVNTNPKVGTLRIWRPEYADDNDEYMCRAMLNNDAIENDDFPLDLVSRTIKLTVSVRPTFQQTDQLTTLIEAGKTARIRCFVRVTDPVNLYWQKHNGPVLLEGLQSFDSRIRVSLTSNTNLIKELSLSISEVKYEDSWNYTCIATVPGYNVSINGTVMVKQSPKLGNSTPLMYTGWLYNATNLTCISYGFPYPTWKWTRSIFTIDNNPNITYHIISYDYDTYSQSWLQIYPDEHTQYWLYSRQYECTASNELGKDSRLMEFAKASVPGEPKVRLIGQSASTMDFTILPPNRNGGKPLMHYEAMYRASQGRTVMYGPVVYNFDKVNITIRDLLADSNYFLNFYACNLVGRSNPATVVGRTDSGDVPNTVQITSSTVSSYPYAYTLRWAIPANNGMPLIGYKFRVLRLMNSTNENNFMSTEPNDSERIYNPILYNPYIDYFRLDDLEAKSLYRVIVTAKNNKGSSKPTIFFFKTPVGDRFGKPPRIRGFQNRLNPNCEILLIFYPLFLIFVIN